MARFLPVDPKTATGRAKELLDSLAKKFGHAPNIARMMANSPAALEGYLNFSGALANGKLDPQLRERIAIAVANANGCNYCLSAHTAIGKLIGLASEELTSAQNGESAYENPAAALRFATKLVRERGRVTDSDIAEVRQAGFDDAEIVEIVGVVALNIFTNYFNHVAETEIDFPLVKTSAAD